MEKSEAIQQPKKRQKTSKSAAKSNKLLYLPELQIHYYDRYDFLSVERRFKCEYSVPQSWTDTTDTVNLKVMVLDNKISILVLPFPIPASRFVYLDKFIEMIVSGKQKKGSKSIDASNEVATLIHHPTGRSISLRSPIAGRIMELNDTLVTESSLEAVTRLTTAEIVGEGFIAVIASEAPRILKNHPEGAVAQPVERDRVCFAWLKGECMRGNNCRFEHSEE